MIHYRNLRAEEICRPLFRDFIRRQPVTACWRRERGRWVIRDDPFIDDWTEADYNALLAGLRRTAAAGGLVRAAFAGGALKGFASVEPELFGGGQAYLDLSNLHVSADMRRQGIGAALFSAAAQWARAQGAAKLYISAHSAVETQAFYRKLGCGEAQAYNQAHVLAEPYDCQLEYRL